MTQEHKELDALLPGEIARRAEEIGVRKAGMDFMSTVTLSILAGAFIALGAIFSTTVISGLSVGYGIVRLLAGLSFSLGLVLVIVSGAELFTGNNLIVMAAASGKVSLGSLFRNWAIVYVGNFAGAVLTSLIVFISLQYTFGGGSVGLTVLTIASAKCQLGFLQAVTLGVMCNVLVCLAVWLCLGARSIIEKIPLIVIPITAFVAAGFEHSIANMYFIPAGLWVKQYGTNEFWSGIGKSAAEYPALTWNGFLMDNLLPVTLGNIFGGAVMVGLVYWFIYLRPSHDAPKP